jgi:hypothetical protein
VEDTSATAHDVYPQQNDDELNTPERELMHAVASGALVDLRVGVADRDDPARGADWGADRTVRAALLVELLIGARTPGAGRPRAVKLCGARISGVLDVEAAELVCPLLLVDCHVEEPINLNEVTAPAVRLRGCHLVGLAAEQMRTIGNLDLHESTVVGDVVLLGAHIGGRLSFTGAHLTNPGGRALSAGRLVVDQGMFFRGGFVAEGEVHLLGARIGGQLDLGGARLNNPGGKALQANWIAVGQYMLCTDGFTADGEISLANARIGYLDLSGATLTNRGGRALTGTGLNVEGDIVCPDGFTAEGEIDLSSGRIGGQLVLDNAKVTNPGGRALSARSLAVGQSLFCRDGFTAEGEVRLIGARIGGVCNLTGVRLTNPGGRALYAVRLSVDGDLLFRRGFTAEGEVELSGAAIGGRLDLDGARLINPGAIALNGESLTSRQNMTCRDGFTAEGEIYLIDARIAQLDLSGATLTNPNGNALFADRLTVDQNMFCRDGFTAEGTVRLVGARIGGRLSFKDAALINPAALAVDLEAATAGELVLRPRSTEGGVNLTNARVGLFGDDPEALTAITPGRLLLRGFTYETLDSDDADVRARLRWLSQHQHGYTRQIYDQLSAAYRRAGDEESARKVAIAEQWRRRAVLNPAGKLTNWLLCLTVGYGYRTWLAAIWLAGLLGCGTWIFDRAHPAHMVRTDTHGPAFHAVAYTLDVLVPIVDLGQQEAWQPQGAAMYWSWAFMAAGWVLTTAVAAGLTGLAKWRSS